jgi:hypothetical protein
MASNASTRNLVRLAGAALAIALLAGGSVARGAARSHDAVMLAQNSPTPDAATSTMTPTKHRDWRHRGGTHPHFGSRRVRTSQPDTSGDR